MTTNLLTYSNIASTISERLNDYAGSTLDELMLDNFQSADPFIIGTYKANEALNAYQGKHQLNGTFGAIEDLRNFYLENGYYNSEDEFYTCNQDTFRSPELLANAVANMIAEEISENIQIECDYEIDDKLTEENIANLKEALNEDID